METEALTEVLYSIPAVIVFIIGLMISVKLSKGLKATPERVERAKAAGRTVIAHKIREDDSPRTRRMEKTELQTATYEYEVDGVTYHYNFCEKSHPAPEITLCWERDPKHAFWQYSETFAHKTVSVMYFLLPFAAAVVTEVIVLRLTGVV